MSYGGFEYERGFGGGFDPMGGFGGFGDAGGGGGFMGEEKSGGRGSEQKSRDRQSLLPLTVKQILNIRPESDSYRVDDVDLHMLKLVGTLNTPQEHSTNFTFRLNDCTGTIECKQWIEKDASAYSKLKGLRDGAMVRVIGNLREYEGRLHVLVYDVTPLLDWNELTHHMLEVVLTHCQRTKGPLPSSSTAPNFVGGIAMPSATGFNRGPGLAAPGASLHHSGTNAGAQDQSLNQTIFQAYLLGQGNDRGMSHADVMGHLHQKGVNITMDQLQRAVARLCDDGRLYTTVDDQHHLPTSDSY